LSLERFDPKWGGNPPVLFRPVTTAQGRRAVNPINGQILAASYIGTIVPGTGNNCTNLSNTNPCTLNGIVVQNDPTYLPGGGFRDPVGVQFDPRLGFAWDPFGDGKTAVRVSFGAFHQASTGGGGALNRGPAFVYTRTLLSSDISPTTFQSTPVSSPVNVSGVYRDQKIPLVYQYMFGIQRDLGRGTMLDVSYVGNTQHYVSTIGNNTFSYNYNYVPLGTRFQSKYADPTNTAVPLPDAFLRPTVGYLDMLMSGPATSTRYDGLQVKMQRRFAVGVEIDANYAYSKSFQATGWSQQLSQSLFKGLASTDQTHVFNFSYVYDLPKASKVLPGKITKWTLDNWRISGITTFGSGFPTNIVLTTTDSYDFTGGGDIGAGSWLAVDRGTIAVGTPMSMAGVRLTCNPNSGPRTFTQYFNTSCAQRPTGRGDYGSDFTGYKFRGPGFNNFDVSLFKNFPVTETKVFQFRWEVYNIFNHPQGMTVNNTARFDPAGNQTNASFGQITATRPERRMQGSLRFTF
jgi:hypothetical protein